MFVVEGEKGIVSSCISPLSIRLTCLSPYHLAIALLLMYCLSLTGLGSLSLTDVGVELCVGLLRMLVVLLQSARHHWKHSIMANYAPFAIVVGSRLQLSDVLVFGEKSVEYAQSAL